MNPGLFQTLNRMAADHNLVALPRRLSAYADNPHIITVQYQTMLYSWIQNNIAMLAHRRQMITETDSSTLKQLMQEKKAAFKRLKHDWLTPGNALRLYQTEARKIATMNKDYFLRVINPTTTGVIVQTWIRHINQKIHNVDVARDTANRLVDNIRDYVQREWQKTQERTIQQLQAEAASRGLDAVFSSAFSVKSDIHALPGYSMTKQIDRDVWQMVKHVHYDVAVASSLTLVSSIWFTPLIASVAAFLGANSAESKQISQIRRELGDVVRDIMSQIYTRLTLPNIEEIQSSIIDHFFEALINDMTTDIEEMIRHRLNSLSYEGLLLLDVLNGTPQQITRIHETLQQQQTAWENLLNEFWPEGEHYDI